MDEGHGRIEWRGIEVRTVTPAQMGFPHVAQVARIDRIRELKSGRQEVETIWIVTSLTADRADAARLLELARQYWSIENGTHYPLDVSAGEDRCRVRHPVAAQSWAFCVAPCKAKRGRGSGANPAPETAPVRPSWPKWVAARGRSSA